MQAARRIVFIGWPDAGGWLLPVHGSFHGSVDPFPIVLDGSLGREFPLGFVLRTRPEPGADAEVCYRISRGSRCDSAVLDGRDFKGTVTTRPA